MDYIGIDPGLGGAVAVLSEDGRIAVFDTPTALVKSGSTRREYLPVAMAQIIQGIAESRGDVVVLIERQQPFPRQGGVGNFKLGMGYGLWIGLAAALGLSYDFVSPADWKAVMMRGSGKEKEAARVKAQQLFPALAAELSRAKDRECGRSEALLIAEYRRRQDIGRPD